jgi:hypothetical protein
MMSLTEHLVGTDVYAVAHVVRIDDGRALVQLRDRDKSHEGRVEAAEWLPLSALFTDQPAQPAPRRVTLPISGPSIVRESRRWLASMGDDSYYQEWLMPLLRRSCPDCRADLTCLTDATRFLFATCAAHGVWIWDGSNGMIENTRVVME